MSVLSQRRESYANAVPSRSPHIDTWSRPPHPADVAQSRLFDEMMQAEIAELHALAALAERAWRDRSERHTAAPAKLPEAVLRVHARIAEAERMLAALRGRFPGNEIRSA
ncbi:hypothetical protein A5784_27020 [Mycobacterium sp. 852013-50091_SCH5140682]|nr:hypothetical protein A5784_27020 [Mycobacterium sp. 852013-50091_SCH5140682]